MFEHLLVAAIDTSLLLFGALVLVLLYVANEVGFRVGLLRACRSPWQERELAGIGRITAGLLAFILSLTINIARNRFALRRNLVVQEANAIETAWRPGWVWSRR